MDECIRWGCGHARSTHVAAFYTNVTDDDWVSGWPVCAEPGCECERYIDEGPEPRGDMARGASYRSAMQDAGRGRLA